MHPMMEKVKNTISTHNLIQNGDHIIVGVSGGPDSVCLLHILHSLAAVRHLKVTAVHVNHKMRPIEADKDQHYVEALTKSLGILCRSFVFDVPKLASDRGLSSEETGREVRYQAFYQVKTELNAQKIAVAQNSNDQAETLLMRILRGTGTDGLAGIEYIRENTIIRPLLDTSRDEIDSYCRENSLNPRIDLTNLQPIYTRNKIRLELIPYLRENYNENITQGLLRLSAIAREDKDYIYESVDRVIAESAIIVRGDDRAGDTKKITIPCSVINNLHPAISKRVLIKLFGTLGLIQDIQSVHLEKALKLIKAAMTSLSMDFPGGYSLRISYGLVEFLARKKGLICEELGKLKESLFKADELTGMQSSQYRQYFDYDRIQESQHELLLRTRKRGDGFSPLGMKGSKKIKDYFIDEKIPRDQRDCIPLVCLGAEVVWIVGLRISDRYKITADTKTILMLEYSKIV
jgi:tRNA(Ile)-lysidine synthase